MKTQTILAGLAATIAWPPATKRNRKKPPSKQVCVSDSLAKMITIDTAKTTTMKDELSLSGEVSSDDNNVVKVFPLAAGRWLM
jgi:cobalt-zinc-cadmium efflux system membrane fusion protein